MSSRIDSSTHHERQSRALRNRNKPRKKIPVRAPRPISVSSALQQAENETGTAHSRISRHALVGLLVLLQICLLAAIFYLAHTPVSQPDRPLPTFTETRPLLELRYQIPGHEDVVESVYYGDTVTLHEPVDIDGYTFLRWIGPDGREEDRISFPVFRDMVYTARLVPSFETEKHIPYLTTDEEAVLDVDGPVTIREFVNILYLLLDTDETGTGRFVDVAEDDSCFEAAAWLKDVGILTGSRLHPDANLSVGEMLEILNRFFPAIETDDTCEFQDLAPDSPYYSCCCAAVQRGWIPSGKLVRSGAAEDISRGRFARIMNHVLGRDAVRHLDTEDVGTILDVPVTGDYYDDVVEAVIPHEYRMRADEEIWTSSEALPVHEPGFFFAGVRLHYIAEDGSPAVNTNVNGLDYNRNGEVTSGDAELDRALWDILDQLIEPAHMDREEMLHVIYQYMVDGFSYRYGSMYAFGAEGWAVKEAKRMLEHNSGNCYCYAALFYELARFIGYDAKLYSGRVYGEQYEYRTYDSDLVYSPMGYTPHGWVEIEFDGEPYIFDPEYEYRSYGFRQMFMAGEQLRKQFGYVHAEND